MSQFRSGTLPADSNVLKELLASDAAHDAYNQSYNTRLYAPPETE
jgi:hypothetical protein